MESLKNNRKMSLMRIVRVLLYVLLPVAGVLIVLGQNTVKVAEGQCVPLPSSGRILGWYQITTTGICGERWGVTTCGACPAGTTAKKIAYAPGGTAYWYWVCVTD
jgi:hypothetical protein